MGMRRRSGGEDTGSAKGFVTMQASPLSPDWRISRQTSGEAGNNRWLVSARRRSHEVLHSRLNVTVFLLCVPASHGAYSKNIRNCASCLPLDIAITAPSARRARARLNSVGSRDSARTILYGLQCPDGAGFACKHGKVGRAYNRRECADVGSRRGKQEALYQEPPSPERGR